jgi:hypothetical protein
MKRLFALLVMSGFLFAAASCAKSSEASDETMDAASDIEVVEEEAAEVIDETEAAADEAIEEVSDEATEATEEVEEAVEEATETN